jgi:phosphinothricin acetyltransferase
VNLIIRNATVSDARAVNDIINWYIKNTAINFDTEPWTVAQRSQWIESFNRPGSPFRMLVGECNGEITGFANNTKFRTRSAYNSSTETTVYTAHELRSGGRGGKLYEALLEWIVQEKFHRAYAVITLPNPPSVALHEKMGFKLVGVMDEVGRKFGRFHDTAIYQKNL